MTQKERARKISSFLANFEDLNKFDIRYITDEVLAILKQERSRIADFVRQQGLESGNKTLDPEITARMIEGME